MCLTSPVDNIPMPGPRPLSDMAMSDPCSYVWGSAEYWQYLQVSCRCHAVPLGVKAKLSQTFRPGCPEPALLANPSSPVPCFPGSPGTADSMLARYTQTSPS